MPDETMCGRYALSASLAELAQYFRARDVNDGKWEWTAGYNIAPAAIVPVIALDGRGERAIVPMRWGLHPHWSKELPKGRPLFNARLETASDKPSFRTPWRRRRALIPYSGWYEWERLEAGQKMPFYIRPQDHADDLAVFAGLWDQYRVDEGITLLSMTILTQPAAGPIKHIHHRMPVRLDPDDWQDWLDPDVRPERTIERALSGHDLTAYEVDAEVNSGRAQGEHLRKPA